MQKVGEKVCLMSLYERHRAEAHFIIMHRNGQEQAQRNLQFWSYLQHKSMCNKVVYQLQYYTIPQGSLATEFWNAQVKMRQQGDGNILSFVPFS